MKKIVVLLFLCSTSYLIAQKKTPLFSKKIDTVSFPKKSILPSNNTSYNSTYYELQKFKAFQLKTSHLKNQKKYLKEIHAFTKDSLQILAVKLISIQQLNEKKLLDIDIAQNKAFYVTMLHDLRESDIDPNEYLFLENKLSKILINEVETKYEYSKWLNIILGISFISLLVFFINSKRKKATILSLSKQETTVKNLILTGKSNKEIAQELYISLSTVKTHITSIYHKLNISNRDELSSKFKNTTSTST